MSANLARGGFTLPRRAERILQGLSLQESRACRAGGVCWARTWTIENNNVRVTTTRVLVFFMAKVLEIKRWFIKVDKVDKVYEVYEVDNQLNKRYQPHQPI